MAEEVCWTRLIYLGRRGTATAWRVHEREGGVVLFIVPLDQLKEVVHGMRLVHHLLGADPARHAELQELLSGVGLESHASRHPHGYWRVSSNPGSDQDES